MPLCLYPYIPILTYTYTYTDTCLVWLDWRRTDATMMDTIMKLVVFNPEGPVAALQGKTRYDMI